jgi:methionine biosynthesis protein MetW
MLRPDQKFIAELIPTASKVIDIGCGEGELLEYLVDKKNISAHGLEIEADRVSKAVSKGISVIQGDADSDLKNYPDKAFDYAVLSMTLQIMRKPKEVLIEISRIAENVILVIPNFGQYSNRLYLALKGRMPVTSKLSYQWYETPNIHFCTIRDMQELIKEVGCRIINQYYVVDEKIVSFAGDSARANLLGNKGIFLIKN